jgi:hypothetical protein
MDAMVVETQIGDSRKIENTERTRLACQLFRVPRARSTACLKLFRTTQRVGDVLRFIRRRFHLSQVSDAVRCTSVLAMPC